MAAAAAVGSAIFAHKVQPTARAAISPASPTPSSPPSSPVRLAMTRRCTCASSRLSSNSKRRSASTVSGFAQSSLFGASLNPKLSRSNGRKRAATPASSLPIAQSAASAATDTSESSATTLERMPSFLSGPGTKYLGTGRRKCAIARVCLMEGTGRFVVNGKPGVDHLQGNPELVQLVRWPVVSLGYENKYDIFVKAHGGGISGQAGAIMLGIARALCVANAANRTPLKRQQLLTRDSRVKERRKYGLKKARKAPQFSKR